MFRVYAMQQEDNHLSFSDSETFDTAHLFMCCETFDAVQLFMSCATFDTTHLFMRGITFDNVAPQVTIYQGDIVHNVALWQIQSSDWSLFKNQMQMAFDF